MIDTLLRDWLALSDWAILLTLGVGYLATALVIHWLCFKGIGRERVLLFSGVVPPFFVASTTVFALLTGFLASDVWNHEQQAKRLILEEADGVRAVYDLSVVAGSDTAKLQAAARDYVASVLKDEWPSMTQQSRSPATAAALDSLLQLATAPVTPSRPGRRSRARCSLPCCASPMRVPAAWH